MSDNRLIKSGVMPSEEPIDDFAVVDVTGRPLAVCVRTEDVWTWDLLADEWTKRPLADFDNGEYGIPVYPDFAHAAADVVDGRLLFAAGGQHQPPGLWDLTSGELLNAPSAFRAGAHGIAMTRVDGRTVVVAGSGGPEVWTWDPSDDEVEPWGPSDDEYAEEQEPLDLPGHDDDMCGLVTGWVGGRQVVVSGGGSTVVVSDLGSGELIHQLSADELVHAVALSEAGGRPVVLATTDAGEIRIWDAVDGGTIGNPTTGHEGRVSAVDAAVIEGRTLAVTGSDDGTARIWDLEGGRQIGPPLAGHRGEIWTVAITPFDGRHAVLTAGRDGIVRVWDLPN